MPSKACSRTSLPSQLPAAALRLEEATKSGHAGETVEAWHTFERELEALMLYVEQMLSGALAMIKLVEGWSELTAEQLIREGDVALYRAKESGRDRSVLARASGIERIHVVRRSEHSVSAD
jgi:hypothetical protein